MRNNSSVKTISVSLVDPQGEKESLFQQVKVFKIHLWQEEREKFFFQDKSICFFWIFFFVLILWGAKWFHPIRGSLTYLFVPPCPFSRWKGSFFECWFRNGIVNVSLFRVANVPQFVILFLSHPMLFFRVFSKVSNILFNSIFLKY